MVSQASIILGVDGGGTKSTAWLAVREPDSAVGAMQFRVLGRGAAGPANPHSAGFDDALEHVKHAILSAFSAAHLPLQTAHNACLCLAGAGRIEEQQRIANWAKEQGIANNIHVISDVQAVLAAIDETPPADHPPLNKIALICGTGSMAYGTTATGRSFRCGGWGYLLDDPGSGYWLGQQALALACQSADGRSHEPALLESILRKINCTLPEQIIGWTYGHANPRQRIAGLAPLVCDLAACSSPINAVLDDGAHRLASLVQTVRHNLGMEHYVLAVAGGLICNQSHYAQRVLEALEKADCPPLSVNIIREPVQGALRIAMQL